MAERVAYFLVVLGFLLSSEEVCTALEFLLGHPLQLTVNAVHLRLQLLNLDLHSTRRNTQESILTVGIPQSLHNTMWNRKEASMHAKRSSISASVSIQHLQTDRHQATAIYSALSRRSRPFTCTDKAIASASETFSECVICCRYVRR